MAPSSTTSALLPPYWKRAHTMTGEPILPPIPCPHISMFLSLCRLHIRTRPSVSCYSNLDTSVKIQWRMSQTTWASYQIRKIVDCACAGNAGNIFPSTDFKWNRQLAIPACITARAWRTCRDACRDSYSVVVGKTFPAFPAHAQPAILRIWQEAHGVLPTDASIEDALKSVYNYTKPEGRFNGWDSSESYPIRPFSRSTTLISNESAHLKLHEMYLQGSPLLKSI